MPARGSIAMQFVPSEVYEGATPPSNPTTGQLWRNTSVVPNELVAWKGLTVAVDRLYEATKTGASVYFNDISENRSLFATVKTVASQAAGTPTPTTPLAITGKNSVKIACSGVNILKPGTSVVASGVTITVSDDGTVTLNGTCTASTGSAVLFQVQLGFYLNGTFTFSMNNPVAYGTDLQMRLLYASGQYISSPNTNMTAGAINRNVSFTLSNQYVWGYAIRFQGGITYTNTILKPQLEAGSVSSAYIPYEGAEYSLTPDSALYGLSGYEDSIDTDGAVIRKTQFVLLSGTESISSVTDLGTVVRVGILLSALGVTNAYNGDAACICSRFTKLYSYSSDTEHFYVSNTMLYLFIAKTRLSAYTVVGVQTWLTANNTQVLYQLATSLTSSVSISEPSGVDGDNVVASDGASISVAYAGSGWVSQGVPQRIDIESVSISKEQGLRVDTILSSDDGATEVPTYFNARSRKFGLFRLSDGRMLIGAIILPNGESAGVADALISPGTNGDVRIGIDTNSEGSGLGIGADGSMKIIMPTYAGSPSHLELVKSGEAVPLVIQCDWGIYLDGEGQVQDLFNSSIKALNILRMVATDTDGIERAYLKVFESSEGSLVTTDGAYSASDSERTISNFCPGIQMSNVATESIVYNATPRLYFPKFQTIKDDFSRYTILTGGTDGRKSGVIVPSAGLYRFVWHVEMIQSSTSTAISLVVHRLPGTFALPTTRNYILSTDLSSELDSYRDGYYPYNSAGSFGTLVVEMACLSGDKVFPTLDVASVSKNLTRGSFTVQKIG